MQIKTARLAVFILTAALFTLELHGQNAEQQPLIIETRVVNSKFLSGQNVEIKFGLSVKKDVNHNTDGLLAVGSDFTVEEFVLTKPVPIGQQKEYDMVIATLVIKPADGLAYGQYKLENLRVDYHLVEMDWQKDKNGKEMLVPLRKEGAVTIPAITLEKVPLAAFIAYNASDQEVVNISEHSILRLVILKEKNIEIFNNLPPNEQAKLGIKNAADLDKPALDPFKLVGITKEIKDRGEYEELTYTYTLALYEVSPVKMFVIPSMKVFYQREQKITADDNDNPIQNFETPAIKVRTNSILMENSEFRPLKNILSGMDPWRRWLFVKLPLLTAKVVALAIVIIFLWTFSGPFFGAIKYLRKHGVGNTFRSAKERGALVLNRYPFVSARKLRLSMETLRISPDRNKMSEFIRCLRCHIGNITKPKLGPEAPQSLTSDELLERLNKRFQVDNIRVLEISEYLLDENIESGDIDLVKKSLNDFIKKTRIGFQRR